MQLHIDVLRRKITTSTGVAVALERPYPLPDGIHEFIVRQIGNANRTYLIDIKESGRKQPVQRGTVRLLSATVGQSETGDSIVQSYKIPLDPAESIFPISDLARQLMESGITWDNISPMFDSELHDCIAAHSSPQMASDGEVSRRSLPASGGLGRRKLFTVRNASWAIQYFDEYVSHVYLWMGAAGNAKSLLDAIGRIQAGELTPVYNA